MTWPQDVRKIVRSARVLEASGPSMMRVTYSATVTATRELNGKNLTSITHFGLEDKPAATTASNIPEYSDTFSTPIFDILCKLS